MMNMQFDDETIVPFDEEQKITTKFIGDIVIEEADEPSSIPFASNQPPWRIELNILDMNVQIVFDFQDTIILGRSYPDPKPYKGIDLSPFDAYKSGLSRNHAMLILEQGNVLIRDLKSLNSTALNGKRLQPEHNYVINSGDIIHLAKLKLRIRFLHNPFIRPT